MSKAPDLTLKLARFAAETRFDDLPEAVVREASRLLLDTIGCALGAIHTPSGRVTLDYARLTGGEAVATVLGKRPPRFGEGG